MRKTVIYEYNFEVPGEGEPDEMVDNVVDAMDLAESVMREGLGLGDKHFSIRETEWSPVSVNTKENENE